MAGLKHVIITGGTGGFGTAIAARFQEKGWDVTALGRNDLDLMNGKEVKDFFSGRNYDLLICGAGSIRDQPIYRMDANVWDDVFELNFMAAKRCAEHAIKRMAEYGNGHVIFISSHAAIHPGVGQAAYATAKSALLGLTKDLAAAFGGMGVRVNTILPGFMDTPMTGAISPERRQTILGQHALGKFNTVESAAEFLWFLQEHMACTSGQIFQLDSRPSF
ncbi:MAG: SDR family oxidoreductase [Armatimonadetes bacterium]|nr:SDR family oxidoreductase [Akkermansiaceae bacterium]